ncbi:MAG: Kazal-type serine protease inhibitor domain-containing protein [Saprospiraceae bacterium]
MKTRSFFKNRLSRLPKRRLTHTINSIRFLKFFALAFWLALGHMGAEAQPGTVCVDSSLINPNAVCPLVYDPVCGCDGVTYGNECEAVNYGGVTSWTPGPCPSSCIDSTLINNLVLCTANYDPVCGCDGETYANECIAVYHNGVSSWTSGACGSGCTLSLAISSYEPFCDGADVCVSISGGIPPFTFTLNGVNQQVTSPGPVICFHDLPSGTYYLIAEDAQGCSAGLVFHIPQAGGIYDAVFTPVSCFGGHDGSIELDIFIDLPLLFYWEGPNGFTANTEDIYNLEAGIYHVEMTTLDGVCVASASFTVAEPPPLEVVFAITSDVCDTQVDGCLKIGGGTPPYYLWVFYTDSPLPYLPVPVATSTGVILQGTTPVDSSLFDPALVWPDSVICAEDIPPGIYYVVILDSHGCLHLEVVNIEPPHGILVTGEVTAAVCGNTNSGAIDITVDGHYPPYYYQWSNGDTTEDLSGIGPGIYKVEVYNLLDVCVGEAQFEVEVSDQLITNFDYDPFGDFACVDPEGGILPYQVIWINLLTGDTLPAVTPYCIYNLEEGSYMVQVFDVQGCSGSDWFFVDPHVCTGGEAVVEPDTIESGSGTTFYLNDWWGASLQWQFKTDIVDWTNIPGATDEVYPTPVIHSSVDREIWVRAVVICPDGTVMYSSEALLFVYGNDLLVPLPGDVEDRNLFNPGFRREELEALETGSNRVSILPTMSGGHFRVVFNYSSSLPTQLLVLDVLGRVVTRMEVPFTVQGEATEMDFTDLRAGAYFLSVQHFGKLTTHRFVIVR